MKKKQKTNYRIRSFMIFCLLAMSIVAKAQGIGTSCSNPVNLSNVDSCYNFNIPTSTNLWLKFYATSSDLGVVLRNIADSISDAKIDEIKIYNGSCSPTSVIDSVKRANASGFSPSPFSSNGGDSIFVFNPTGIVVGNLYYLSIILVPNSCTGCSLKSISFDMCLKSQLSCGLTYTCDLVQNGSFETYTSCPTMGAQITNACPWTVPQTPSTWGSSDYLNSCHASNLALWGVPLPSGQTAHTGNGLAGIYTYAHGDLYNFKEYIQENLFLPLVAGKTYYFEMYVSLYGGSRYATDEIGVYFSNTHPTLGIPLVGLPYTPQIVSPSHVIISAAWTRVSGCYTATGGEQWITLGSFRDNASIDAGGHFQLINPTATGADQAYYLFDDVSIKQLNPGAGSDQTITCAGDQVTLGHAATCLVPGATYSWSPVAGLSDPNILHPIASPSTTTTYTLTVTSPDGCTVSDIVTVTVIPPIPFSAGSDITICAGSSAPLSATGAISYTWTPGTGLSCTNCSSPIASPSATTTYTVTGVNANGCTVTDNIIVTVENNPVVTASASNAIIPLGCKTDLTASSNIAGTTFIWQPGSITGSGITVSPMSTTTYTVTGTTLAGCSSTATATITVITDPFTVTGNTSACAGMSTYSVVSPITTGITYTWTTSTGLSGSGSTANVDFNLTGGGTITFTGTYAGSCTYSASLHVGACCTVPGFPTLYTGSTTSTLAPYGTVVSGTLVVTNLTFAVNGIFTVNQNLTLRGCDLRMGYLSKVIVNPGITLTITSNTLTDKTHIYACGDMWDGIYIQTATATVVINNGTTIEDALNAVVSDNKGNYQISSSILFGDVIFNKNYESIIVKNSPSAHPGVVHKTKIQCYDGVVGGNPLNTSNKLHYPHASQRSYAGIDVTGVVGLTIGNNTLPTLTNTFDNLDFGILGYDSNIDIYNNNFQNISSPVPPVKARECNPGTAICVAGNPDVAIPRTIRVGSFSGPYYKNMFTNCTRGVIAYQNLNLYVLRNSMSNTTIIGSTGVRAAKNYSRAIQINENVINNMAAGIECFDNRGTITQIDNNDIDAGTLLQANGILAQELFPILSPYTISRNTIHNVRNGVVGSGLKSANFNRNNVYLKHPTTPGQYGRGIRLEGSSFSTISANYVLGQNTSDYWIEGISVDVCYSDKVLCNETHNIYSGMLFGGVQTPNTQIAKNEMNNDYQGFVLNVGEVGPQYTVVGGVNKPNDNKWTGAQTLHTYSYNSTGSLSPIYVRTTTGVYNPSPYLFSTTLAGQQIVLNPIAGNLNTLICPLIALPGGGSPHLALMLQIAGDSIVSPAYDTATRWMLKQSLYKLMKDDPTIATLHPMLTAFQATNALSNLGKLDHVESLMSDPATLTPSTLATVKTENNSVIAANDAENNTKWVNAMIIDNEMAGIDFSEGQLADLRVLAAKCPYNDGQAVYTARTILSQFENAEYMNDCEILPQQAERSMLTEQVAEEEATMFSLYPNPNDGTMNFIYSLDEASKGELILYDLTGKFIIKYTLQAGKNNQLFIQDKQLNNGVYFYKVIVDNEVKASDKIVIIK